MENVRYTMFYIINKGDTELRILGKDFVKNNRNKAKLIIENKKYLQLKIHVQRL